MPSCSPRVPLGLSILIALSLGAAAGAEAKTPRHARHAPSVHRAPADAELRDQVRVLQAQVAALQTWHDADAASHAQADRQIAQLRDQLARADARAEAANAAVEAQIKTIPSQVQTAAAAAAPRSDVLRYKGVTITPSAFLAAEGIYRSRNEGADVASSFASIPFANTAAGHTRELRGTARQTRLALLLQGDANPNTHAAFYGEFDFQAAGQTANPRESNSFSPRIRNLYGTVDWDNLGLELLAGQNWSLLTTNTKGITPRTEAPPPTIDAQYVPGFSWTRQPQIRLVKNWNKQVWLALSLESPQTSFAAAPTGVALTAPGVTAITAAPGTAGFDIANSLSFNRYPDVIAKLAYEPAIWADHPLHVELYGLLRSYYDRVAYTAANPFGISPGSANTSASGGGVGGGLIFTAVPKRLDVQASFMTGRGIGRYGSGQLPDAVIQPNGRPAPIPETMFLAGATLHATPALDLYAFGGQERQRARTFSVAGSSTAYGFGNPAANLSGCDVEGGTCVPNLRQIWQISVGMWDKAYQGDFGQLRVGLQYSHTSLTAFSGVGGQPTTSDDMVFTSFRYYPF
ncbi:MAG: hypothetical protein JWP49_613 [Phenylobacterium sp.]|nr:hypothetical protein [Phenylobacterium sp.]